MVEVAVPRAPIGAGWLRAAMLPFSTVGGAVGMGILLLFAALALFGHWLVPHDPMEIHYLPGVAQRPAQLAPPSAEFWLGTTYYGRDNFSQLIIGTRVAFVVGIVTALIITVVGTNIGLVAGYLGGRIDDLLMRLTDVAFGIPFLPFAVVLVALLKPSLSNIILTISVLMWRTTARVIRSQVLSLKERPFVRAARVAGAGKVRIMYVHILPNVLPMSLLYVAFGVAWAVIAEASLSFLGLGDPDIISWGQMLYSAYLSGSIRQAWWTAVPPGVCISLFVISVFLIGRQFELTVNPRLAQG